jgi:hypothetical protein
MINKFLEAKAKINQKTIDIVNTQMDISIEYFCKISEEENNTIYLTIKRIFGNFNYNIDTESYKKNINVSFETDTNWVIKTTKIDLNKKGINIYSIEPEMAIIDFDQKLISVNF